MANNIDETDFVFYCTRCLSIDVRTEDGITYCPHCFTRKNPSTIDITNWSRWEELHIEKYGHPLVQYTSIYDDVHDTFAEDAVETISEYDAANNNLIIREKMNLNLDRLRE